jgi:hypothetical protein
MVAGHVSVAWNRKKYGNNILSTVWSFQKKNLQHVLFIMIILYRYMVTLPCMVIW